MFMGSGLLNQKLNNADMMTFQAAANGRSGAPSTMLGHVSSKNSNKQNMQSVLGDYTNIRHLQAGLATDKSNLKQSSPDRHNLQSAMSSDTEDYQSPMRPANIGS